MSLKFLPRIDFFTNFEMTIFYQKTQVGHSKLQGKYVGTWGSSALEGVKLDRCV
jgi:hypothetical protein